MIGPDSPNQFHAEDLDSNRQFDISQNNISLINGKHIES